MICNLLTAAILLCSLYAWMKGRPPPTSLQFTSEQLAPEHEQAERWHMWLRGERCGRAPDDEGMRMGGGREHRVGLWKGGVWRVAHVWQRFVAFERHLRTRRDRYTREGASHKTISNQIQR